MKVHFVLASPVELGVAFLPSETNHLGEREPFHADVGKAFPHFVQTSLPDYGIDPFHGEFLPDADPTHLGPDLTWIRIKSA